MDLNQTNNTSQCITSTHKQQLHFTIQQEKGSYQVVQIDLALLPFIFSFTERTLSHSRLSPIIKQHHPIATQIFDLLKTRIIPKRKKSRTGRTPTRMKYEEKIKFVMRSIQQQLARMYNRTAAKMMKFNIQEQRSFFKRQDVRNHFLYEMPREIIKRIKKNDQKINEFTQHIYQILQAASNQKLQHAKTLIDKYLKTSQLPWSFEMFQDIKIFSLEVFREFTYEQNSKTEQELKEEETTFMRRCRFNEDQDINFMQNYNDIGLNKNGSEVLSNPSEMLTSPSETQKQI